MKWFYLCFPALYGETWHSDFQGDSPVALVKGHPLQLQGMNKAAENAGLEPGMSLSTAFCLAPGLQTHEMLPAQEKSAIERAATLASDFSAWVATDPPDGLYLEVASMQRLFGDLTQLRNRLLEKYQQQGLSLKIAAAPYPIAARLLARAGQAVCVSSAELEGVLARCALGQLELREKTLLRLQKLGINSMRQLLQISREDLAYRVDAELATYLNRATGKENWRPEPFCLPETFFLHQELEEELESLTALLFPLSTCLRRFCQFLQKRCWLSQQLELTLKHRHLPETRVCISLAQADHRYDSWLYMLTMELNRLQLPAPVLAFALRAAQFEELPPSTYSFFEEVNQEAETSQAKAQLLNRLAAKISLQNLEFLQSNADPRPERQTAVQHSPVSKSRRVISKEPSWLEPSLQPLWLLPVPQPVYIREYQVLQGPARLDTGWWDDGDVQRDYYIALHSSKALHWLFRTPENAWFVQGLFA